jgi:hypothetical protein
VVIFIAFFRKRSASYKKYQFLLYQLKGRKGMGKNLLPPPLFNLQEAQGAGGLVCIFSP